MSKWCSDRSVCAPQRRSAATAMSPKVSFSMRCSAMAGSPRAVCTAMPEWAGRMLPIPYPLARPFLFGLDPEHAHDLTLTALASIQRTPFARSIEQRRVRDPVTLAGLVFPNRVGLAAGLDKNGRCIDAFGAMGFGKIGRASCRERV